MDSPHTQDGLKIKISSENELWIQDCCQTLQTTPPAFLNSLLNYIKSENGLVEQNLPSWIKKSKESRDALASLLERIEATRVLAEETTRATRLYILQASQKPTSTPTTP